VSPRPPERGAAPFPPARGDATRAANNGGACCVLRQGFTRAASGEIPSATAHRTLRSAAYTGELALDVDRADAESGEAACLRIGEPEPAHVIEVAREPRWPDFARRALNPQW
jgi:hypothetical protein